MNKRFFNRIPRLLPAALLILVLLVTVFRTGFAATTLVSAGVAPARAHYPTLSRMARSRRTEAVVAGKVTGTEVLVRGDDVFTLSTVKVRRSLMGPLSKGDTIELLEYGGTFRGHAIGKQLGGSVSLTTALNPRKEYEYRYSGYNYAAPGDNVVLFLEPCSDDASASLWQPADATAGKLTKTADGRYDWDYPMEKIGEMEFLTPAEQTALYEKLYSMKTIESAVEKVNA